MSELALRGGAPAVVSDWQPDWPYVGPEEMDEVMGLLRQGVLSIYDRSGVVAEFEDAFAAYHGGVGTSLLALTHNSGTSALHAAFFGLGLGPGDEVIVPTYTFLATVTPLVQCGATPVFADMDAETLTLSPGAAAALITPRTAAIVVTHMWGHPAEMDELTALAARHGLALVEDCSHAHGATFGGRKVGTFGDVACFSLEGHKPMVAGEGGVLLTRSRTVYERALLLGHFGRRAKEEVTLPELRDFVTTGFGHKYRIHPLGAAIALHQLRRLDERNEQRRANLDLLTRLLTPVPGIVPPSTRSNATRGGWYGYKPRYLADEVGRLDTSLYIRALQAEGVRVKLPGSPPLHRLSLFALVRGTAHRLALPWADTLPESPPLPPKCPVAEAVYPTLLSLPTFSGRCDPVIHQYAAAFEKIGSRWHELVAGEQP